MGGEVRRARAGRGIPLLLALAACPLPRAAIASTELPPIECVRAVRQARIEATADPVGAARSLELALDAPGCELPALAELIQLARAGALPDAHVADLRRRLEARIGDSTQPLPDGFVEYLATLSQDSEDDRLLLQALARRLGTAPKGAPGAERRQEVQALLVSARLQRELGLHREALATYDRLQTLDPSESWLWEGLNLAYRLEDWPEVARRVEAMASSPGAAERLRPLYVRTLAHLGRFDELMAQLDRLTPDATLAAAEPIAPVGDGSLTAWHLQTYADLLSDVAWTLRDAGRDTEAEALFRRVLAVDPQDAPARLALLHLYGSEAERAEHSAAVAARRQKETDPHALFEEGSQLLASGDAAAALELLARAAPELLGTPEAEAAWYNLGLAAYKLELWERAADAFGRAEALNPDRPETHSQRGLALARLDRCAEAVPELERFLVLRPDRHEMRYYLARCYEAVGRSEEAAIERGLYQRWKENR